MTQSLRSKSLLKLKMARLHRRKGGIFMVKKKMKLWKKVLLILAIIIILIVVAFVSYKVYVRIDMEIKFKEFEKRQAIETKGTLSYIGDDNCAIVENMDYITQDEIGVKIDSISITDDTFSANISFKIDKEFDYKTLGYGYAIYDENKNIYEINTRMHLGENEKYDYDSFFIQRELGINKNKDIYSIYLADRAGIENISRNENEKTITTTMKIEAKDKFPKSKKIYIKLFDLGYFNINRIENEQIIAQNFNLSDAKWQFEFDIPEEMNKRETINLKLANEIPGLEVTNMTITETKLVLNFNSEEYINLISAGKDMPAGEFPNKCKEMLNITDGEGKVYQETGGGTTGNYGYKDSFDATKKDLTKKLFINFKVGDTQYKSELVEK